MFDALSKMSALWLFVAIVAGIFISIIFTAYKNKKRRDARQAEESTFGWQLREKIHQINTKLNNENYSRAYAEMLEKQKSEVEALISNYAKSHSGPFPQTGPWAVLMKEMKKRHAYEGPKYQHHNKHEESQKAEQEGFAAYTAKGPRPWKVTYQHSKRDEEESIIVLASSYDEAINSYKSTCHAIKAWPAE